MNGIRMWPTVQEAHRACAQGESVRKISDHCWLTIPPGADWTTFVTNLHTTAGVT